MPDDIATVTEVLPPSIDPVTLMQIISRAASDPATDVDKFERLTALYERLAARQAEQQFNQAMRDAQAEIKPVFRNRPNEQTRSRYADLQAVSEAIDPIVTRHGFSQSFGTDQSPLEGHYRVTCKLAHVGGHSRDYFGDVPSDTVGMKGTANKTATHGFGSSMSYGRRYLKLMIWDVATTDDDDGNMAGGQTISPAQIDALTILADQVKADVTAFCAYLNVESIASIPVRDYKKAEAALQAKARQTAKTTKGAKA